MRGFDIFMKVAKLLCERRRDVLFVVVGDDRICYGGNQGVIGQKSFKDWVLARDQYDLSRFIFTGLIAPSGPGRLVRHQRSAHLFDRPLRAFLVDDERPRLWDHGAGVRYGPRAGNDPPRQEWTAGRFL